MSASIAMIYGTQFYIRERSRSWGRSSAGHKLSSFLSYSGARRALLRAESFGRDAVTAWNFSRQQARDHRAVRSSHSPGRR